MCQAMMPQTINIDSLRGYRKRSITAILSNNSHDGSIVSSSIFLQNGLNPFLTSSSPQDKASRKRSHASLSYSTSYDYEFDKSSTRIKMPSNLNSSIMNTTSDFDPLLSVVKEGDWDMIQSPLSVFDDDEGSKTDNEESPMLNNRINISHHHVFLPFPSVSLTSGLALIDCTSRTSEGNESYCIDDGILFNQLCEAIKEQENICLNHDDLKCYVSLEDFCPPGEIRFDSATDDCCSSVISDLSVMDDDFIDLDDSVYE